MFAKILAIVLTCAGIGWIVYILKVVKGLKIKYGAVGMILIFMPYSLGIVYASSGGELKYNNGTIQHKICILPVVVV